MNERGYLNTSRQKLVRSLNPEHDPQMQMRFPDRQRYSREWCNIPISLYLIAKTNMIFDVILKCLLATYAQYTGLFASLQPISASSHCSSRFIKRDETILFIFVRNDLSEIIDISSVIEIASNLAAYI